MKNFVDKFITFILSIFIVIIFSVTVFFSLDMLEIVDVPKEISLVDLIYSKMEVISTAENYVENIIPSEYVNAIFNTTYEEFVDEGTISTVTPVTPLNIQSAYGETASNTQANVEISDNLFSKIDNYYYNQLDEYGKIIYNSLYNHKNDLKSGTYTLDLDTKFNDLLHLENGSELLNNSFQLSVNALTFDHPEIFYVDITKMYLLTEITTKAFSKTYRVSIGPNGGNYLYDEFPTESSVNNAIVQVESIKNNILSSVNANDYTKIKYVHDYLVDTIEYDKLLSRPSIYSIYGALANKKAVCEGYAKAFKYVLDEMRIPCVIVCGIGRNSSGEAESHAWNYIQLNDSWYAVDVTWDDPIIIGNGRITDDIRYHYFLKGANSFFEDHIEDGNIVDIARFTYPKLNVLNF